MEQMQRDVKRHVNDVGRVDIRYEYEETDDAEDSL
jgi:hypothetical protein